MAAQIDPDDFNLREQIARIAKTQAGIDKMFERREKFRTVSQKTYAEHRKLSEKYNKTPRVFTLEILFSGAGLVFFGAVLGQIIIHHY